MGVFVDIDIIKKAPSKLLASGCGDLIANIIAVKIRQLSIKEKNTMEDMQLI
jgi:Glycerol dehydrogenase and related enzymes